MATKKFILKDPTKDGLCLIMLLYQDKGKKFKFSTKIQVKPELWNGSRVKGKTLQSIDDNNRLMYFENILTEIEREAVQNNKKYAIDIVEKKFRYKISDTGTASEFFKLYDQFVEDSKVTKTAGTIKGYGSTKTRLKEFEEKNKLQITFEGINKNFYEKLVSYLISELKLLNNSVGKHIKTLKCFLNYVRNNELVNIKFNTTGFKVFKEDIDIIALTHEELFKIYNCKEFSGTVEHVRDYFCFECFTGMRFSDIGRIQHENLKGDFLEFRTQKTKDSLIVPLNVFAKEIIAKYKGQFANSPLPPVLSNQKTNEYLKDIAEVAGVTDIAIIEKFSGSDRRTIKKQKCDLVSTHTGRRTFITLSYEKGMTPEMIMKITGIKSWNTLKKYLKISEHAKLIKMNEFWNNNKTEVV